MVFSSVAVSLLKLLMTVELVFVSGPDGGAVTAGLMGSWPEAGAGSAAGASGATSPPPLFVVFEAAVRASSDEKRTESNLDKSQSLVMSSEPLTAHMLFIQSKNRTADRQERISVSTGQFLSKQRR